MTFASAQKDFEKLMAPFTEPLKGIADGCGRPGGGGRGGAKRRRSAAPPSTP